MSTRQLRKLQKQKELAALEAKQAEEEESEDEQPILQRPKSNAFAGFAALGGMEDEQEDDDDGNEDRDEEHTETTKAEAPPKPAESERIDTPKSSSKKNKKKKKKAKKAPEPTSTPSSKEPVPSNANEIDEIDRAIQELNMSKKSTDPSDNANAHLPALEAYERICNLLRVNTHHLKVLNEMRHLFGRDAIAAAQNEEEEEQARNRRNRQQQQNVDLETFLKGHPGKSLPEVTLRRNPFLQGKESWPRASMEGLSMAHIPDGVMADQPGTMEFAFVHNDGYNTLEETFFSLVNMYDPMNIVRYLKMHPYHVSSLIQVSKVARQDQNSALSADLCERALFSFGRVSLSAFRQKIEEGKARLDFRRPENRQFWLAGYHYLKNLVMKGTYRTALEWAKLLLSMDPSDPYGMIHFIHPLAIRARESKWFIDFCDSEALDRCDTAQDYARQTLVLAKLQQKDVAGAKTLLTEGMRSIPWLYSGLFKALNLDVPKSIWGQEPRNQHEKLFVELYIHQAKILWDNAQATALLKETAAELQKPDWSSFATTPLVKINVCRFVYLDNTPSLMGAVPGGMLSVTPNFDFDPLPPPREDNVFSHESQKRPWDGGGDDERDHAFLGRRGLGVPNLGAFGGPGGAGAEEILVPRDPEQLRRFLEIMTEQGAPPEVLRLIAQDIAEDAGFANDVDVEAEFGNILGDPAGDDEHVPAGEGDDGSQGEDGEGLGGRLRDGSAALFDLLNHLVPAFHTPWSAESGGPRIPGGFPEDDDTDTDDEMPPLIPQSDAAPDGQGGGDGTDSDDEMPPLVPPSNSEPRGSGGNERSASGGDGGGSDDDMPGLLPP